jgi:glycosyltransferase involved in cell wall biosynthesis
VYAGRLDQPQKRVLDLPLVVEKLAALGARAELSVVGDGPSRADLLAAADGLIVRGLMRMLGTRPNAEVLDLFERSDALILTSAFEGLPVCLLEAMGRGCVPVVADVRSGIPELIEDGVNGFRVPVGDTAAFAERLARLAGDPELRRRLSLRAFRTVTERGYDAGRMAERYIDLFEGVLERGRSGAFRRPRGRILCPPDLPDHSWKDHLPPRLRDAGTRALRALRRSLTGAVLAR